MDLEEQYVCAVGGGGKIALDLLPVRCAVIGHQVIVLAFIVVIQMHAHEAVPVFLHEIVIGREAGPMSRVPAERQMIAVHMVEHRFQMLGSDGVLKHNGEIALLGVIGDAAKAFDAQIADRRCRRMGTPLPLYLRKIFAFRRPS